MSHSPLGFLGLGAMGTGMASNLLKQHSVIGYDLKPDALQAFVEKGGTAASSEADVLQCDVVFISVSYSEILVEIAENTLIPHARNGQIFIDMTTVVIPQARRLAGAFAEKGAHYLDCPVSGGPGGAAAGKLWMFCGGDKTAFEKVEPILHLVANPETCTWCGPSGAGQVVKAVNQLGMGLIQAAAMEAFAYGVNAGIDADLLLKAVCGNDGGFRAMLGKVGSREIKNEARWMGVKYDQFAYFAEEAKRLDFPTPIMDALSAYLEGKPAIVSEANRMAPSYWSALTDKNY